MATPTRLDEMRLKRVVRYMSSSPRVATCYPWEPLGDKLTVECDSDFAGCVRTRKSTAGGVIYWGDQFVKAWSRTLPVIALSTGEAELASVVRASTEGLGLQSVLADLGLKATLEVASDATAAIGIVKREGLGRVRHLAVADLWIQQKQADGTITYRKVPGTENSSDLMRKGLGAADMDKHLKRLRQMNVLDK